MKKGFVPLCFVFIGLFLSCSITGGEVLHTKCSGLNAKSQNDHSVNIDTEKPRIDFAEIPLYFIANKGQVNDKARFYAKAAGYTLWLTKEGLVFDSVRRTGDRGSAIARKGAGEVKREVSRFYFVNANTKPEILPVQKTKLRVNYFIGADRSKWHGDIPTSQAVLYKNLYKGIDLKVYGIEKQIEYDWIVRPGENPKAIRFEYKGVKGTRIDDKGNLLVETDSGELIHKRPVTYQEIGDRRVKVRAEYRKTGENSYGFEVGEYDKSYALIIDPVVLAYSTYLGGAGNDRGYGIAVDSSGNAYVAGPTKSTDFPILNQYQATKQGLSDVFVARIDTTRSGVASLIYSTYLGGSGEDCVYGIAADNSGNAYVTGDTDSTNFPILNQYQTNQAGYDAFVTKIDTTRSGVASLIYSTYLGGAGEDGGSGISADNSGNAYVTGETNSANFPILNQYQATNQGDLDAFVTKIDTTQSGASSLIYSTYLGGADSDRGYGIAADSGGNAYVTGNTDSANFPTRNQYQATNQGDLDAFVTKIDTTQSGDSSLIYSTYLGGEGNDYGQQIAADSYGNAYVTGSTESTDFPILNQYQAKKYGISDVFVTRIDTTRSGVASLIYSTYLGGGSYDMGGGIAADSSGNAYVTGKTRSTDFPILNQYQTYQGDFTYYDAFVTKIDTTRSGIASLIYSTYLGGADTDRGSGIAVDSSGNAYVTGNTGSTDFPILNQYQTYQGSGDVFVTKLAAFPPVAPPPPDSDNDGLPDSEEQGPDGDNPDYDGNGDGIPDWEQSNVTSWHTRAQDGSRHYITLEVPEGQRIEYPYSLRTFETPPPYGVSFPYGFFTFKITGLEEGGSATMTIYLDGDPPQTYYKYGKTPDNPVDHWYEFSYDGETGAEVVGDTIVLHFTDGLRGDHDLKVNGEIKDPGGPAAIETIEVLYFPYLISTGEEETLIGIINTENYTVTSTISYYRKDGDLITTANMTLGSKGKTTISSDSIPSNSASAIISADGILSGYTRYVNSQGQRCAWPANMQPQDSIPVPHTAINSNWATALCLFNPNDEDVEVTLDYDTGISGNFTLIAKSQDFFWLTETEPVSSISATGYIAAMEMFDSLTPGGDRAALLLKKRYLDSLYVPCISYGAEEFTGVGLINGYHDGTISVFGHNEMGEVEEISLGSILSQERIAVLLSGILDDDNLWARLSGEADFTTPFGTPSMLFDGLAVYGEDNTGKLGAVNLNALRFKEGFLGIISTDPEPFFALLNPDTVDATLCITAYQSDGAILAGNTIQIEAGNNMTGVVSDLFEDISLTDVTHIRIVSDMNIYGSETIYTDDRMEMLPVLAVD